MSICDFEKFAVDLFESKPDSSDEALLRSCISRLYYSVYHRIQNWLMSCFAEILAQFGGGSHEKLRFCCDDLARNNKELKFKTVSIKLKTLHDRRTRADYKLEQMHQRRHVQETLAEMRQLDAIVELLIQTFTPNYIYKSL